MGKYLEVIELKGDHYEIGYQHGKKLAKNINQVIETRYQHLKKNLNISFSGALKESGKYLHENNKYFPEYIKEIEGIADGAGIPFEKVFFLQVASEFAYRPEVLCSAFAVAPKFTESNEVIIGQNWDNIKEYQDNLFVYKIESLNKPSILMFGYAGVLGYMGINQMGAAHVVNSLKSSKWRYGVTHYFLHRKLYEMNDVDDFIDLVNNIPISSAANFLISDGKGKILDMEISVEGNHEIRSDKILVHTNHFIHSELQKNEKFHDELNSSVNCLNRLTYLINKDLPASLEGMMSILTDHDNYPYSICRHDEEISSKIKTVASLIFLPQTGKIYISKGNPCVNEYECFSFDADHKG